MGFPGGSVVKNLQETRVPSLGREDPLEKEMATHSSILAWRIPWTKEPGGQQSTGSQRVGHGWARTHTALSASPLDFTGASNSLAWKQNSALPNLFLCILPRLGPWNYPRFLSHSLHPGSLICFVFQRIHGPCFILLLDFLKKCHVVHFLPF